jgi:serine/threonine-protein kinase
MLRTKLIGKGPTLQVEAGEVPVVVPSVLGMAVEVAKQLLERNMLIAGDEVVYQDSLEPADTVLSQFPDQGKLAKRGDTVNLVVSSGPASVPTVVGMSAEDASEILEENSLRVLRTYCVTDEQPPDHVVASTPSAGTEVTRHSEVVLLIAHFANGHTSDLTTEREQLDQDKVNKRMRMR